MKRCGIVAAIAGFLLFSGTASAAEETNHGGHSDGGHGMTQVQQTPAKQQEVKAPDMQMDHGNSHNMTPEQHKNMDMGNSHDMQGMTHDGQSSGGGHGSHGGNEEVVETPPNIPVLSTFGGIMLAFILYGAWNKWLRKKERAHA